MQAIPPPEDSFSKQNKQGLLSMHITSCCICLSCGTSEKNVGSGEAKVLQQGDIFASDRPDMNLFLIRNDDSLLKEMKFHLWVIPKTFAISGELCAISFPFLFCNAQIY